MRDELSGFTNLPVEARAASYFVMTSDAVVVRVMAGVPPLPVTVSV